MKEFLCFTREDMPPCFVGCSVKSQIINLEEDEKKIDENKDIIQEIYDKDNQPKK